MTKKLVIGFVAVMALGSVSRAATITVDNDGAQCPNATHTSIQAAVTAANPGDTIRVCPGTYAEQVVINKNLKVEGFAVGNENLALIMPAGVVANSFSLTSASPIAGIIVVDGASNVSLTNLTVDGAANGISGCAPTFVGVYYRNSSGKMNAMAVRNIRHGAGFEGCQSGLGIFAQSGGGGSAKLEVTNSSVHDYQKNGITANEAGTELTARGNAVTGFGVSPIIAQNGIQVGFGAKGTIEENSVINHIYGPCTPTDCGAVATSVLGFESPSLKVKKNNLGKSQVNVYIDTVNGAEISNNVIFDTDVFDGIFVAGNNSKIEKNTIFNSDEAAVWVDGNNNNVRENTINEAPIGVYQAGTGNSVTGNKFFNTEMNTDSGAPIAPTALSRSSVPARAGASPLR